MTTVATLAVKDTKDIDNTDRGGSRIISRNIGLIRGQTMCITAYARIESGGRSWGGRGKLGHGVASLRIGMPRIRGDRAPPSSPSLYSITNRFFTLFFDRSGPHNAVKRRILGYIIFGAYWKRLDR